MKYEINQGVIGEGRQLEGRRLRENTVPLGQGR